MKITKQNIFKLIEENEKELQLKLKYASMRQIDQYYSIYIYDVFDNVIGFYIKKDEFKNLSELKKYLKHEIQIFKTSHKHIINNFCQKYKEKTGIFITPDQIINHKRTLSIVILRHAINNILYQKYGNYRVVANIMQRSYSNIYNSVQIAKFDKKVQEVINILK